MRRPLATKPVSIALLVLNAVGALVYLLRAAPSWKMAHEYGNISLTGEASVWTQGVVPVLAVFLVVNIVWGGLIRSERQSESGLLWLLLLPLWIIAIGIDFAHH